MLWLERTGRSMYYRFKYISYASASYTGYAIIGLTRKVQCTDEDVSR